MPTKSVGMLETKGNPLLMSTLFVGMAPDY